MSHPAHVMRRYVLLLAEANDLHALAVGHYIQESSDYVPVIIDTGAITTSLKLAVRVDGPTTLMLGPACSRWPDGATIQETIALDEVKSIWIRRYRRPEPPGSLVDEADRDIARRDSIRTMDGLLYLASRSGVRLLNEFPRDSFADNKLLQLGVARACGMTIPRTLVSNDPVEASRFYHESQAAGRKVIVKSFRAPDGAIVFTRFVEEPDLEALSWLRHAPAIFQEFVDGDNLRVTIIGRQVFPARVLVSDPAAVVDWRMEYFNAVEPFPLTGDTADRLLAILDELGLAYGAFDLKLTPDGEAVFLEVNPAGQFLFVEIQTGMAISAAIAGHLIS